MGGLLQESNVCDWKKKAYLKLCRIRGVVRSIFRHHEAEVEQRDGGGAEWGVDQVGRVPLPVVFAPVRAQAWRLAHVHEHSHRLFYAVAESVLQFAGNRR